MKMKNKVVLPVLLLSALGLAACKTGNDTSPKPGPGPSGGSESTSSVEPGPHVTPKATGAHQYVDASYDQRAQILGKLEGYAINHGLQGIPLYENGGYMMYSGRVVKGTNTYITNYGFSTLRDGELNGNLAGETVEAYQNYYHNWESSDPGSINGLDADGSQIGDLYSQVKAGLFGQRLNADKTDAEWYGVLSKEDKLLPLDPETGEIAKENPTAEELFLSWRAYVRTGEQGGVAYRTGSQIESRAAFDGRYVTLDDYVTGFRFLMNGANGFYRGGEMAEQTGKYAIAGLDDYYNYTKAYSGKGIPAAVFDQFLAQGIQTGTDERGDYIDFTFKAPANRFFAMYNVASDLFAPIPAEFITLVGADDYGNFSSDKSTSPVDNILCLGPWVLDSWVEDQLITFKRNDDWWEKKADPDLYRIDGIHTAILTGYEHNRNIGFEEFLANKLDGAGIPIDYLNEYKSDPRATQVPGDSVFKLNLNCTTPELWEELFGVNGTIKPHTEDKYWNVKPWMSNENFIKGINFSIDRATYALNRGVLPSINFFADNYMADPEEGVSYNATPYHEEALESYWGDTVDTYGYNQALAIEYFQDAIRELVASGDLTPDMTDVPLQIRWMYQNMLEPYGNELVGYLKGAFDAAAEDLGYQFRLAIEQVADASNYMVVYNAMMGGEFDIGFGSVSGNTLDPLNFMEVLCSDNRSGFTLNWGPDTSIFDEGEDALVYDDMIWSFDTLYQAADSGIILDDNSEEVPASVLELSTFEVEGESVIVAGKITNTVYPGLEVNTLNFFGTTNANYTDYFEVYPDGTFYGGAGDDENEFSEIVFDEVADGWEFSFTINGETAAAIIAAGGLLRAGSDYTKYIDGVYLGLSSAYCDATLPA